LADNSIIFFDIGVISQNPKRTHNKLRRQESNAQGDKINKDKKLKKD